MTPNEEINPVLDGVARLLLHPIGNAVPVFAPLAAHLIRRTGIGLTDLADRIDGSRTGVLVNVVVHGQLRATSSGYSLIYKVTGVGPEPSVQVPRVGYGYVGHAGPDFVAPDIDSTKED